MTLTIPSAIFTESFLSYLGLGVPAPIASWGTMASEGNNAITILRLGVYFSQHFYLVNNFCI